MSETYFEKLKGVMCILNGTAAKTGDVVLRNKVTGLYLTSREHVQFMKLLTEYVNKTISVKDEIYAMRLNISQQGATVNFFPEPSKLETFVGKQKEIISLLKNIPEKYLELSEFKGFPFITVTRSSEISRLFDPQCWAKLLEQETHILDTYQSWMREVDELKFVIYKVQPVIITIVLVVGMTGNGLLLTVFVRHKEMRTFPNCMLINLTVVDLVSLVVNVLLDYLRVTTPWKMEALGCQIYFFFSYLLFAVSRYSVAMISVQRFVAVMRPTSIAWYHQSKMFKYVLIATVWCLGFILSVPLAVPANTKNEKCEAISLEYLVPMYTVALFAFCVVPLLITAVFSGLTAYRMRRSIREFPGEATGQEQLKHSRMVSANLLIGLTVLSFVSYAPFCLFNFLIFVVGYSMSFWESLLVNTITYYLRFANCCLNPIVLFVMSKRFRGYIMRYCGEREVQTACNSGNTTETSL
jgi:hypothetical protein